MLFRSRHAPAPLGGRALGTGHCRRADMIRLGGPTSPLALALLHGGHQRGLDLDALLLVEPDELLVARVRVLLEEVSDQVRLADLSLSLLLAVELGLGSMFLRNRPGLGRDGLGRSGAFGGVLLRLFRLINGDILFQVLVGNLQVGLPGLRRGGDWLLKEEIGRAHV